jgi:hypothetical protein
MEIKVCSKCKEPKDISDFRTRKTAKDGLREWCTQCSKIQNRLYYLSHKKEAFARAIRGHAKLQKKRRQQIWDYLKSHPCIDCGEPDPMVLDFDHKDPKERDMSVSQTRNRNWSWERTLSEIEKCEIRCANCHRRRTYIQAGWSIPI